MYLDLETCGLTNASVFLAGTMHWNGTDFVVRQYFARDYAEEAALVHELTAFLAGFETLITYNGKSYDVPFLTDRANLHRLDFVPPPRHLDLVHHARRRWAGEFPNCRLVTLELYVCGRRRSGDIPSSEVPGLYHDYVKYGAAHRLIPVFHHNLIDVITMDEILRALIEEEQRQVHVATRGRREERRHAIGRRFVDVGALRQEELRRLDVAFARGEFNPVTIQRQLASTFEDAGQTSALRHALAS